MGSVTPMLRRSQVELGKGDESIEAHIPGEQAWTIGNTLESRADSEEERKDKEDATARNE